MKRLLTLLMLVFTPAVSQAAITVTFSGTVSSSESAAYTSGQPFEISFVLADYSRFGNPVNLTDDSTEFDWSQEDAAEPAIFSDIRFSGSGGAFAIPPGEDPEFFIYMNSFGSQNTTEISFNAGVDYGSLSTVGLSAGGELVQFINLNFSSMNLFPNLGVLGLNPEEYFSTVTGSYAGGGGDFESYLALESGRRIDFIPTRMTITSIPEPSVIGLGGAALAILGLRRRVDRTRGA